MIALRSLFPTFLLVAFGCGQLPAAPAEQPNVLLVALDTVRWDHTSLSGWKNDTTPNLDRLAGLPGATTFTRAYTAASWSLPAYVSIFTGREAPLHGVGFSMARIPDEARTLAEVLQIYGYDTGAFCSGGHLNPRSGLNRGYDTYELTTWSMPIAPAVTKALDWVEERGEKPWFAFVHGYDAHGRYAAPAVFSEQFDPDYDGILHAPWAGEAQACPNIGATEACAAMASFADAAAARRIQLNRHPDALLVGLGHTWFRGPGSTDRVDLVRREPNAMRVLGLLLEWRQSEPGRGRTAAEIERDWPAGDRAFALSEEQIGLAVATLRSRGLHRAMLDPTRGVGLSPDVEVAFDDGQMEFDELDLEHRRSHYDTSVYMADYQVGRLLYGLQEQGQLDNTLIIVLSDHGERLGETGFFAHDTEFGDAVWHIPLVVKLPATRSVGQPPRRDDGLASLTGVTPTVLELVGAEPLAGIEGESLVPRLRPPPPGEPTPAGPPVVRMASMCCWGVETEEDELLLLRRHPVMTTDKDGLVNRPQDPNDEHWGPARWELYAPATGDRDVAAEQPERVAELGEYLSAWPDHPSADPAVVHGAVADRPDLRAALRDAGYWAPEPETKEPER